jgi:rod shape-determining protein MreC
MLDVHRRTGVLFVAVILGHLTLISWQVTTKTGARVLEAVTFGAFSEIHRFSAAIFGGFTGVWHRYVAVGDVEAENVRLRAEVQDLGVKLQQERARAARGERLELMLRMQQTMTPPTLAADVIGGDASAWFQTITIDKGSRDGLAADLAVIAPAGVVGRIVGDPAPRAARVQLLIDRNAGAGAIVERSRAGGVVVGDGANGLRMDYVSTLADVRPGDVVVTSGLDGIYPKGFVLGTVGTVERGSGLYKTIQLRPAVDFSSIEEVLVVTEAPPRPQTPPEGRE